MRLITITRTIQSNQVLTKKLSCFHPNLHMNVGAASGLNAIGNRINTTLTQLAKAHQARTEGLQVNRGVGVDVLSAFKRVITPPNFFTTHEVLP